jgi:hypothetical protein
VYMLLSDGSTWHLQQWDGSAVPAALRKYHRFRAGRRGALNPTDHTIHTRNTTSSAIEATLPRRGVRGPRVGCVRNVSTRKCA